MRALTIRQPWASLIANGTKTIETRGWQTAHRGPLSIHAAKRPPVSMDFGDAGGLPFVDARGVLSCVLGVDSHHTAILPPLGAVVATCTLADVVPMVPLPAYVSHSSEHTPEADAPYRDLPAGYVAVSDDHLWLVDNSLRRYSQQRPAPIDDQRPYGDFTPGRYAWLLADVRPLTSPVPAKGRQGLWTPDADLIAAIEAQR